MQSRNVGIIVTL